MMSPLERRKEWNRIIGVERRSAPMGTLDGHPLPNPTRLVDEEFVEAQARLDQEKREVIHRKGGWDDSSWYD